MTKFEFLNTLRTAMHGMPADKVERTIADYERRFEKGIAAGRSEHDLAREFGDPWDIAADRERRVPERAAQSAGKAGRMMISGLGLAVFNLFMIIPGIIYMALVIALFGAGLGLYTGGIALTASSLAGVDELAFRMPIDKVVLESGKSRHVETFRHFQVMIHDGGFQVQSDDDEDIEPDVALPETAAVTVPPAPAAPAAPSPGASAKAATPAASAPAAPAPAASVPAASEQAPKSATKKNRAIVLQDHGEDHVRRTWRGISIIAAGIALLLAAGVVVRYSWLGLKRYVAMNVAVLRGA